MSDAFNEQELMESIDGDLEFLEETIEIFVEDGPPLLQEIARAVTAGDAAALATSAHSLKGMLSNFYATPAVAAALELERKGRAGDLTDVEAAVDRMRLEAQRLGDALQQFLEKNRS